MPDIRSLSKEELIEWAKGQGHPAFRAKQIYEWLWKKHVASFEEMANLPKLMREQMSKDFELKKAQISDVQISTDGTRKYAFKLTGGQEVEGVLIPTQNRVTACISSQAGCSLSCHFCATGLLDLKHNLRHYEIYDQLAILQKESVEHFGRQLSNIVYMGMGEPLLNYQGVLKSIYYVTSKDGMAMSPKRITVSTSGIAKMIKKLGDDDIRFEFALSLHAANDETRSRIMPINDSNTLANLKEALQYFYEKTGTRVTLEWCLFKDVNDSLRDAEQLFTFSRCIPTKINLIEYNPFPESGFVNTTPARKKAFVEFLEERKVIINVRRSRGRDIDGGCGQLAMRKAVSE